MTDTEPTGSVLPAPDEWNRAVEHSLGQHGLVERFDAIVSRELQTRHKPHPEPFLKAAEAICMAPQDCLALEDSHNGVRAAAAAGMMTVMVPDLLHATDEMREMTVAIADSLHHALELVDRYGRAMAGSA